MTKQTLFLLLVLLTALTSISCQSVENTIKEKIKIIYKIDSQVKYIQSINYAGNSYITCYENINNKNVIVSTNFFKLDTTCAFFQLIKKYEQIPYFNTRETNAYIQKADVFVADKKIFSSFASDNRFWELFRTIMEKIPENCNPFVVHQ